MIKIIFTLLIGASTVILLNNCGSRKLTVKNKESIKQNSSLANYGKQIFDRESCIECHTLQIENETDNLISLDGIGFTYSNSWLYHYLNDPKSINPSSMKISSKQLNNYVLNKRYFTRVSKKDKTEDSWSDVVNDAEIITNELKENGIDSDKTELIALIAYLQSIPKSPLKFYNDSVLDARKFNETKIWNNLISDSSSIILKTAQKTEMSVKGKTLFHSKACYLCHGENGQGIIGPNLTDKYWLYGGSYSDIAETIIFGRKNGMKSWKNELSPKEVGQLISFISSLQGGNPPFAKEPQGSRK